MVSVCKFIIKHVLVAFTLDQSVSISPSQGQLVDVMSESNLSPGQNASLPHSEGMVSVFKFHNIAQIMQSVATPPPQGQLVDVTSKGNPEPGKNLLPGMPSRKWNK